MPFDKDNRVFMVAFLVISSLVVTSALSALYAVAEPIIEEQKVRLYRVAVLEAFGLIGHGEAVSDDRVDELYARVEEVRLPDGGTLFRAYETAERVRLLAEAFEARGSGLWSEIILVVALTPDRRHLHGLAIVEEGETPGLGGRISEPWFLEKFSGLELGSAPGYVSVVAYEPPDEPHEIDAISGATQTSKALEAIINNGLSVFISTTDESGDADGQAR